MGMKPILKFFREMPDFQLCHRTLLSIYLDSIAVPFFSHLWESTQKGQPVSSNLLEPLMLKGYWIGLGRARGWACDSNARPQLAYRCPRAAPHLEVVWDPCALPLGAFSVAPVLVSEQFPHHLPTAGAGGLTEFQGAALDLKKTEVCVLRGSLRRSYSQNHEPPPSFKSSINPQCHYKWQILCSTVSPSTCQPEYQ